MTNTTSAKMHISPDACYPLDYTKIQKIMFKEWKESTSRTLSRSSIIKMTDYVSYVRKYLRFDTRKNAVYELSEDLVGMAIAALYREIYGYDIYMVGERFGPEFFMPLTSDGKIHWDAAILTVFKKDRRISMMAASKLLMLDESHDVLRTIALNSNRFAEVVNDMPVDDAEKEHPRDDEEEKTEDNVETSKEEKTEDNVETSKEEKTEDNVVTGNSNEAENNETTAPESTEAEPVIIDVEPEELKAVEPAPSVIILPDNSATAKEEVADDNSKDTNSSADQKNPDPVKDAKENKPASKNTQETETKKVAAESKKADTKQKTNETKTEAKQEEVKNDEPQPIYGPTREIEDTNGKLISFGEALKDIIPATSGEDNEDPVLPITNAKGMDPAFINTINANILQFESIYPQLVTLREILAIKSAIPRYDLYRLPCGDLITTIIYSMENGNHVGNLLVDPNVLYRDGYNVLTATDPNGNILNELVCPLQKQFTRQINRIAFGYNNKKDIRNLLKLRPTVTKDVFRMVDFSWFGSREPLDTKEWTELVTNIGDILDRLQYRCRITDYVSPTNFTLVCDEYVKPLWNPLDMKPQNVPNTVGHYGPETYNAIHTVTAEEPNKSEEVKNLDTSTVVTENKDVSNTEEVKVPEEPKEIKAEVVVKETPAVKKQDTKRSTAKTKQTTTANK